MMMTESVLTDEAVEAETLAYSTKTDKPRRIAILSYRSTPHVGGQGIYLDYLSRALVERGHDVDIISGPPYPEVDERVNVIEIPSLDLYAQPHNGHFALRPRHFKRGEDLYEYFTHLTGKFAEPLTFGERLKRYFAEQKPEYDVIIDNQTLTPGLLSDVLQKTPIIGIIHHPITQDRQLALDAEKSFRKRLLIRRWYGFIAPQIKVARQMPIHITSSGAIKKDIMREFGLTSEQLRVIPLGVAQEDFHPRDDVKREPLQIITTASADVPLKGLIYLLRAVAKLRDDLPDLKLKVIGKLREGATSKELEALGISDMVSFESGLTREELARAFCAASIAVTPSLYEGFGLPCAEAMSCGTPVLTTDGGALPEVVGDAGLVVPKADPEALATALRTFFKQSDELKAELGQRAFERAQLTFNWSRIAPVYETVIEEAIAR